MNENLDLTKILEGCPKGTKFYNSVYGEVSFEGIDTTDDEYPIEVGVYDKYTDALHAFFCAKDGRYNPAYKGECTLFPSKEQRDWSKFERFWNKPNLEKFDPNTLQPFDKVLVRDEDCYWTADLFSHIDNNLIGRIRCSGFRWQQCIPYNDETKDLVGTKNDCPEYYKWWEG